MKQGLIVAFLLIGAVYGYSVREFEQEIEIKFRKTESKLRKPTPSKYGFIPLVPDEGFGVK